MKRYLIPACIALLIGFAVCSMSGCNTMEGLGKDVQTLGRGISGAAD